MFLTTVERAKRRIEDVRNALLNPVEVRDNFCLRDELLLVWTTLDLLSTAYHSPSKEAMLDDRGVTIDELMAP